MSTGFSTIWLEERFRFDAAARNAQLEHICLKYIDKYPRVNLVDVGAGSGANVRHWAERIPQDQSWTLVEQDGELLAEGLQLTAAWGKERGFEVYEGSKGEWIFSTSSKKVQVKGVVGSLLDINEQVDLTTQHMVMANAVFDLFSVQQFETFARQIQPHSLAFYPTINYAGMGFEVLHPGDAQMVAWYEGHMERNRPEGRAMGKTCSNFMQQTLSESRGRRCHRAK